MHKVTNFILILLIILFIVELEGCSSVPISPQPEQDDRSSISPDSTPRENPKKIIKERFPARVSRLQQQQPKKRVRVPDISHYMAQGHATWYRLSEHGAKTRSGQLYDLYDMTAAHATLPLLSRVKVINPRTGRSVIVTITDRINDNHHTLVKLSYWAARRLGLVRRPSQTLKLQGLPGSESNKRFAQIRPLEQKNYFATLQQTKHRYHASPQRNRLQLNRLSTANRGDFYLQVGAFAQHKNANRLRWKLSRLFNYNVFIELKSRLYQVRIGPINRHDIGSVRARLRRYGLHDVLLVR